MSTFFLWGLRTCLTHRWGFEGCRAKCQGTKQVQDFLHPPTAGTSGLLVVFEKGEGLGRRGLPSD